MKEKRVRLIWRQFPGENGIQNGDEPERPEYCPKSGTIITIKS
jgi:hypothetical protein